MNDFDTILKGGDLRSIGQSNKVASCIDDQQKFDALFKHLFHHDRKVVMRTADAIEKITVKHSGYLKAHKKEIVELCSKAKHIELKWHLALLLSRITLSIKEFENAWQLLSNWATDKKESKIVRVNSLQGLFNLLAQKKEHSKFFLHIVSTIEKENIPSLNARIRKLKNEL